LKSFDFCDIFDFSGSTKKSVLTKEIL
jgi:hypothetical protein